MFKPAALLAVVAIALLVPVAAQARAGSHHFQRMAAQKERELRHTQAALRSTRVKVASLSSANAELQTQLGASQQQADTLQSQLSASQNQATALQTQLATVTSQRDAAQAQLAEIPTPIAIAVQQVQHEVAWAGSDPTQPTTGQLTAEATMNYVVGHVSTGAYGYLELNNLPLPDATPNSVLAAQAGICGHAALTFASIMIRLGYTVRSAQFYYSTPAGTPDSHIAVEVQYDGSWHFFDPTFGVFWTDPNGNVLSIADERANGGTEHKDDASFTNLVENLWYAGDDTAFETDPATVVELDKRPFAA